MGGLVEMKENIDTELIKSMNRFEDVFTQYYKAFFEFLEGEIYPESKYKMNHPTLFKLSNELQVVFYKLPNELRNRLLHLEFEVFLHCNNLIDFYNFRIFLIKNQRFNRTTTIAERVEAEVALAKLFVENCIWERYEELPSREFQFYRPYDVSIRLMQELEIERANKKANEKEEQRQEIPQLHSAGDEREVISSDNESIFDNISKKVKQGEEVISTADSLLGKSIEFITKIATITNFIK